MLNNGKQPVMIIGYKAKSRTGDSFTDGIGSVGKGIVTPQSTTNDNDYGEPNQTHKDLKSIKFESIGDLSNDFNYND